MGTTKLENRLGKYMGIGAIAGASVAIASTIYGSYELGSAINDYFHVQNIFGRGTLDAIVMIGAAPIHGIAGIFGAGAGACAGIGAGYLDYLTMKPKKYASYHIIELKECFGQDYEEKLGGIYNDIIRKDNAYTRLVFDISTKAENVKEHFEKCEKHKPFYQDALQVNNELHDYIIKSKNRIKSERPKLKKLFEDNNFSEIKKQVIKRMEVDSQVIQSFNERIDDLIKYRK